MRIRDMFIPPEARAVNIDMAGPPGDEEEIAAIDVHIQKNDRVYGINGEVMDGRTSTSYRPDRVTITTTSAISTGNFVDSVKHAESKVVADGCWISAPPNGITYCVSFLRGVDYQPDGFNAVNIPLAEYYVTNSPGAAYAPIYVHLPRRRQRAEIGIWSPQTVPSGATFVLNLTWRNTGGDT